MSPEEYEGWFPNFRALPRNLLLLPVRIWRKTWRFSLTALILLVIAHTIFNFIAGRKLEAELNRIRQAGEPLTLEEAAPPSVPDSENAAVLYEKAFKQLGADEQGEIQNPDLEIIKSYIDWPYRPTRPTLAQLTSALTNLQSVFPLLEEASLRPACRFPVNWDAGPEVRFPHFVSIRRMTRLLMAKALVDSVAGDSEKTATDIATIIRMANQIAPEPTLISQMVRFACLSIVFQHFPMVLENASFNSTQSRALYDLLASAEDRSTYVQAMKGERTFGIFVIDLIRHKGLDNLIPPASQSGYPGERAFIRLWPVIRVIWRPFLKLDEAYYLEHMQKQISLAAQPYRKVSKQYQTLDKDRPWYALGSVMIFPVFSIAHVRQDESIAKIGLMRGALALRAYQIEHGSYPVSLAQLRDAGGWEILEDPFSGKELIYRRQGQGYILYSVGPNFKDDGGLDFQEARQKNPPQTNFDIAVKMTR